MEDKEIQEREINKLIELQQLEESRILISQTSLKAEYNALVKKNIPLAYSGSSLYKWGTSQCFPPLSLFLLCGL